MTEIPTTMHAVRMAAHGGTDVLEHVEVPVPRPAAGEVLVRVAAAALNNTDLWTREGAYGTADDPAARSGWLGPIAMPRIQGGDATGTIVAVGAGVDATVIGARVVVDPAIYAADGRGITGLMGSERDGAYAEYVAAPADQVHDVSESPLDDAQLASLPIAYGTAYGMLARGRVAEGSTVVVTGASGGVGIAVVQLARALGARVVAVSSASKSDAVRDAGAHEVVDRARDVVAGIRAAAPEGVDAVLDVVAGDLVRQAIPLLRTGGTWVVAGALGGYDVQLDIRRLYLHDLTLVGSAMHTREHFAALIQLARDGAIAPIVAETLPLADAAVAQERLARREHVGKLVLVP